VIDGSRRKECVAKNKSVTSARGAGEVDPLSALARGAHESGRRVGAAAWMAGAWLEYRTQTIIMSCTLLHDTFTNAPPPSLSLLFNRYLLVVVAAIPSTSPIRDCSA
jgi:hypothetical protein